MWYIQPRPVPTKGVGFSAVSPTEFFSHPNLLSLLVADHKAVFGCIIVYTIVIISSNANQYLPYQQHTSTSDCSAVRGPGPVFATTSPTHLLSVEDASLYGIPFSQTT
jgi:hypothetical protein